MNFSEGEGRRTFLGWVSGAIATAIGLVVGIPLVAYTILPVHLELVFRLLKGASRCRMVKKNNELSNRYCQRKPNLVLSTPEAGNLFPNHSIGL